MQIISSNFNFKGVSYYCPKEQVKEMITSRMPKDLLEKYMKAFETSQVKVTFGFADEVGNRLDALVSYKDPLNPENRLCKYIEEKRRFNILDLPPKKFFKSVLAALDSFEVKFDLGKIKK